ncbi:hypothetical protein FDZ74_03400 [bacterium]|nr:hypothetical protein [Deltaproteobacteria bacterium]TLN23801.1 MAG: hypothetical protein FDZ74_03400 [bacterium]
MSLENYLVNCNKLWKEIRDLLAEENIDEITRDIEEIGDSWEDWKKNNETQIIDFCLATQEERLEYVCRWKDDKTKKRIIFAALQKFTDGMNLLLTLKAFSIEKLLNKEERETLVAASAAFDYLYNLSYPHSPEDIFSFDPSTPLELSEQSE